MTTKNIVIIIAGIIIIAGAAYAISSRKNTDSSVKVNKVSSNKKENKQDKLVFNGEARKLIGPIILDSGLVIVKAKNQTGSNDSFSVNIYADENGNGTLESGEGYTGSNISVGYDDAETFDGAIVLKSKGGGYFAEIEGGRWQIIFEPSKKLAEKANSPKLFSGKGIQVTEKFYMPAGEYSFKATNKGGGNFFIYLVDENGNLTSRLINEIGDFEGNFTVKNVFDGNYMFAVTGGDWTITKNE